MRERPLDLGWMRIFDAVARLGSLSRAAQELGLSQPAVTYQIKRIEEQLGSPLFYRSQSGSRLSEAGEVLHHAVRSGLERIDKATQDIRRKVRAPAIRIFTDYGFAAFWLMPRVAEFRRLHPGLEVHIVASQSLEDDFEGDADATVLFGRKEHFPETGRLLIPERVVPVCSPGFVSRYGPISDLEELARAPLLHLETAGEPRWLTWASWLAAHGVRREPAQGDLGLNTYGFVIQAALAEQGVALGWLGLVENFLAAGTLIAVAPEVHRKDFGYWLVPHRSASDAAQAFTQWMMNEAKLAPQVTTTV